MGNTGSEQENGFTKSSSYSALNLNKNMYTNGNASSPSGMSSSNSSSNIKKLNAANGSANGAANAPNHRKKSVSTTSLSSLNAKYNNASYEKRFRNFMFGKLKPGPFHSFICRHQF